MLPLLQPKNERKNLMQLQCITSKWSRLQMHFHIIYLNELFLTWEHQEFVFSKDCHAFTKAQCVSLSTHPWHRTAKHQLFVLSIRQRSVLKRSCLKYYIFICLTLMQVSPCLSSIKKRLPSPCSPRHSFNSPTAFFSTSKFQQSREMCVHVLGRHTFGQFYLFSFCMLVACVEPGEQKMAARVLSFIFY